MTIAPLAALPVPVELHQHVAKGRVCLGELRVERNGTFRGGPRLRKDFAGGGGTLNTPSTDHAMDRPATGNANCGSLASAASKYSIARRSPSGLR